ncbi:MAG: hypothetical protein JSR46_03775 [Verrucomicrobia bacterium]|nr:hypothetical protein [Verrucomicrobiota bacterium]
MCFLNNVSCCPCYADPLDDQTIEPQGPSFMDRATKIFCSIFPWVASAASAFLFVVTEDPTAFLGLLVFGTWSLISLIASFPDDLSKSSHTSTASRVHNSFFSPPVREYTTVDVVYREPHRSYSQPAPTYYSQPTSSTTIFNPPSRPSYTPSQPIYQPTIGYTPTDPTERAPVGRSRVTDVTDYSYRQDLTERAPIGRSSSRREDREERHDATERAPIGRRKPNEDESGTATTGSGATERAKIGRK